MLKELIIAATLSAGGSASSIAVNPNTAQAFYSNSTKQIILCVARSNPTGKEKVLCWRIRKEDITAIE